MYGVAPDQIPFEITQHPGQGLFVTNDINGIATVPSGSRNGHIHNTNPVNIAPFQLQFNQGIIDTIQLLFENKLM